MSRGGARLWVSRVNHPTGCCGGQRTRSWDGQSAVEKREQTGRACPARSSPGGGWYESPTRSRAGPAPPRPRRDVQRTMGPRLAWPCAGPPSPSTSYDAGAAARARRDTPGDRREVEISPRARCAAAPPTLAVSSGRALALDRRPGLPTTGSPATRPFISMSRPRLTDSHRSGPVLPSAAEAVKTFCGCRRPGPFVGLSLCAWRNDRRRHTLPTTRVS